MTTAPIDYEPHCKLISPRILHHHFGEYLDLSNENIISNEKHPEAFYPFLFQTPRGIYLGVGGAQNYLFMQHAQPISAILCDLALPVMAAHHYTKASMVPLSEFTPAEKEWYNLITEPIDEWQLGKRPNTFPNLEEKLDETVRKLYLEDNIDFFCADLFNPKTLQKIVERVHQRSERITAVYLSNALNCISFYSSASLPEQTLKYFSQEEIFDPEGIVLQTLLANKEYAFADDGNSWHYSCLSIKRFCELMRGEADFSFELLPSTERKAVSCFR